MGTVFRRLRQVGTLMLGVGVALGASAASYTSNTLGVEFEYDAGYWSAPTEQVDGNGHQTILLNTENLQNTGRMVVLLREDLQVGVDLPTQMGAVTDTLKEISPGLVTESTTQGKFLGLDALESLITYVRNGVPMKAVVVVTQTKKGVYVMNFASEMMHFNTAVLAAVPVVNGVTLIPEAIPAEPKAAVPVPKVSNPKAAVPVETVRPEKKNPVRRIQVHRKTKPSRPARTWQQRMADRRAERLGVRASGVNPTLEWLRSRMKNYVRPNDNARKERYRGGEDQRTVRVRGTRRVYNKTKRELRRLRVQEWLLNRTTKRAKRPQ